MQLEELLAKGLLSRAGFVGKSKGTLLDVGPVMHMADHLLRVS
jgi:hypothetical protein